MLKLYAVVAVLALAATASVSEARPRARLSRAASRHMDYEEPGRLSRAPSRYSEEEEPLRLSRARYSEEEEDDQPPRRAIAPQGIRPHKDDYYPEYAPEQYRWHAPEHHGEYSHGPPPHQEYPPQHYAKAHHGYPHPAYPHPGYPEKPKVYYGYAAVCDESQGIQFATAPGPLLNGTETGNLEPASVSCASAAPGYTLQVGGYCTAACYQTGNVTSATTVTALGVSSGWYSDDTRNSAGQVQKGKTLSYPGFDPLRPATTAADAVIATQISFGTYPEADTSPTGVMKLWATDDNRGKASVRFYKPWEGTAPEIVPGSALTEIAVAFRWFMEPATSQRTPGFNMLVVGSNLVTFSLSWIGPEGQPGWNEAAAYTVNPTTPGWRLFCNSLFNCPGNDQLFTMNQLLDTDFGPFLLGGSVVGVGFNLGSSQRACYVGIDWLETNLLNEGARIDFGVGAPPPPPTFPTIGMGAASIGGASNNFFSPPTGWTWGIGSPDSEPFIPAQTTCFGPAITSPAAGIEAVCANVAIAVCCAPREDPHAA